MSDMLNDPDLESRVRRAMHSLADAHQPSSSVQPAAQPTNDSGQRRTWLIVAATLLVVAGVVAVLAVAGRDTSPSPVVTEPPVTASSEPRATPNADGDIAIDPADLRFSEPLPDGMVAFVNDTALPAPSVADYSDIPVVGNDPTLDPPPDSIGIVVMDGPRLLMRGTVVDLPPDTEAGLAKGQAVEIGVEGATYSDEDEGAIIIPIDGGRRIVAPDEYFSFGGGGPFIEPDALVEIARAIGQLPLDDVDQLPGFFVFQGWASGEAINPLGVAERTSVEHGQAGSPSLALYRLAQPPTALELLAIGNALFRGELNDSTIGDVAARRLAGSSTSNSSRRSTSSFSARQSTWTPESLRSTSPRWPSSTTHLTARSLHLPAPNRRDPTHPLPVAVDFGEMHATEVAALNAAGRCFAKEHQRPDDRYRACPLLSSPPRRIRSERSRHISAPLCAPESAASGSFSDAVSLLPGHVG